MNTPLYAFACIAIALMGLVMSVIALAVGLYVGFLIFIGL